MIRLGLVPINLYGDAFKLIEEWGYPHNTQEYNPIGMIDLGHGCAYVWFELIDDGCLLIHACSNPKHRGKWLTRRSYDGILWAAELLGAQTIFMLAKERPDIESIVRRLGWQQCEIGWYVHV